MISDAQVNEPGSATSKHRDEKNLRFILLLFPAALVVFDLFLYYFVDFRTGGRSFLYLDSYGQGFFTWWLDFEQFWGLIEVWGLVGIWLGVYASLVLGAVPEMRDTRVGTTVKVPLIILVAIIIVALIFGVGNLLSPVSYSFSMMLIGGWYATYFSRQVVFLLVVFTGIWLLFPKLSKLANRRIITPLSPRMAIAMLVVSLLVLHLVVLSSWSVSSMNQLQPLVDDLMGFIFVTVPLFAFILASTERRLHEATTAQDGLSRTDSTSRQNLTRRNMMGIGILLIVAGITAGILLALYFYAGIDISIDIRSDLVPKSMLSWVASALVASITFFLVQEARK